MNALFFFKKKKNDTCSNIPALCAEPYTIYTYISPNQNLSLLEQFILQIIPTCLHKLT